MPYDPDVHHRRSIRLPAYDYTRAGAYFVTLCIQNRACVLGTVRDAVVDPTQAGRMVVDQCIALPGRFPTLTLDAFVLMPNHWHGILVLAGSGDRGAGPGPATAPSLADIIHSFKTGTMTAYFRGVTQQGWPSMPGRLWQRNYYEHVIRDASALDPLRDYISANPARWALDRDNPARGGSQ